MGASILDLTNSNPISRLANSEYRTLQGLRTALRVEIEKTFAKGQLLKVRKRPKKVVVEEEEGASDNGGGGGGCVVGGGGKKKQGLSHHPVLHYLRPGRD